MGEVRASVVLENGADRELVRRGALVASDVRRLEVEMLVDTGAVVSLLPQDMVEALGLALIDRVIVSLANDDRVELPTAGPIVLTTVGRTMHTDCLVGPSECEPLLGQIVLESLDLIVDPTRHQLTVQPESPYKPTLKLK